MIPNDMKPGDLVAVSGNSPLSWLIQAGTVSMPNVLGLGKLGWAGVSHVGIVVPVFGQLIVYESTSFDRPPCLRTGRQKPKGVQAHYLTDVINGGGDVWHYPLRRALYPHEEDRLLGVADSCRDKDYDYFGAASAWGGIISWTLRRFVKHENLADMFCSELVVHIWGQVGIMQARNAGVWNPTRLVRHAVRTGVCDRGKRIE